MTRPDTPTLDTLEQRIIRETQLRVRTIQPAKVLQYDDTASTAIIELAFQQVEHDGNGHEALREPFVIPNVPVWQFGGATTYVRLPLQAGDTGLALVCDRSLSGWRERGETGPPDWPQLHNLGDVVFLAGLRPRLGAIPPAVGGAAVFEAQAIHLGANPTEAIILGNMFASMWNSLLALLIAHTHPTPAGASSPSLELANPGSGIPSLPLISSTFSNVVKIKG